ncbi:MAG: hypothetical protein EPO57_04305 [Chitinophagaceae bacterium]|nr:MAG: hypothetical protein EPO57_04305 [Chitinophagaceae bacterium]
MMNSEFTTPSQQSEEGKDYKKLFIIVLIFALLTSWAYIFRESKITTGEKQELQAQGVEFVSQRDAVQNLYNESLNTIDSISVANADLQTEKTSLLKSIDSKKAEIRKILNDKNATTDELNKANALITDLNKEINVYATEIAKLKGENLQLTTANTQLSEDKIVLEKNLSSVTSEKKDLENTVDVGSTFSASNIQIAAVHERKSGKERETSTAKRADKLVVSFDIENRIAKSGPTDLYIIVQSPDGKTISSTSFGSGNLATRNDGDKSYTSKLSVNYEQGTRKNISLPLYLGSFTKGGYKIQVYHNGFKIGEGSSLLK